MSLPLCIISLTEPGRQLAQRMQQSLSLPVQLAHRPKPFQQNIQARFHQGQAMAFICATGIVMRTLAPVLQHKHTDPPILVLDEQGRFVIPLLSGHEGGANALAQNIAQQLKAQLVLTTAQAYLNPIYVVGMGCERGCDQHHLNALLQHCLTQAKLKIGEITALSSLDVKADEVGFIALSEQYDWGFETHSVPALRAVEHLLSERSDIVYQAVGVYGVAEAAALVSASTHTAQPAELILTKQKTPRATCAIARSYPINTQRTAS